MFPQKYRLAGGERFWGRGLSNRGFLVKVKKNNLGFARFGAAVPKKTLGKAVLRNKLKRLIYKLVEDGGFGKAAAGADVLIVARPAAGKMSAGELQSELKELFSKLAI